MTEKRIHYFKNNNNSCVITDTRPPRHWYNYLWSEKGYCAQVSQQGHGRSYFINENAEMCQINNQDARYVYIRDDEDNRYWNIGEGPLMESVENYSCEHSIPYTLIQSEKCYIHASWRIFVPYDAYHEIWNVRIKNNSSRKRTISIFSAMSFELEGFSKPHFYEMYRCCETFFDDKLNGVFCKSAHPFAPHQRYNGYIAFSESVHAYDGDLLRFLGPLGMVHRADSSLIGLYQRPDVVIQGRSCTNSTTALFALGGVLQNKLELLPEEEREITIIAGVSESLEEARSIVIEYGDKERMEQSFLSSCRHYYKKYADISLQSPDERINSVMNNWLKKQVDFCIVGKKGVRDNLQIAVALLMYRPEKAKEEILECMRHQFKAGHAVMTWYPYNDTRYSDQPFWIIWSVIELIKETGDYSLLHLELEYQDGGKGTVLEHIMAAVRRLIEDKGPHGLVKIFFADWNDALNVTTDPEAESVMISEQFCLALKELSILASGIGNGTYAVYLMQQYDVLKEAINKEAWDGDWYARAISCHETIGSRNSQGSKIYLNAQTWAVLAGIPDEEKLPLVLRSIDHMEHDFGFPINTPPNMEYSPHVGRMGGMLPGLFENGGVYCHATGFKIVMDCMLGRAEQAINTLLKIMPDSEVNPSARSGAEPYVFTNCYATHPKFYGKSYQSWTTGTSAWTMMALYEGIMGIRRDYDGLRIAPCFPARWKRAELNRIFRGCSYHIVIENPRGISNGSAEIKVDGQSIRSNLLPLYDDGKVHEVEVLLIK